MSYLAVNAIFLAFVLVLAFILMRTPRSRALGAATRRSWWLACLLGLAVVLILTIIFDNLMIWAGLVSYDESALLGVVIGLVPLGDLAYPVAAAILGTSLWMALPAGKRSESPRENAVSRTDGN